MLAEWHKVANLKLKILNAIIVIIPIAVTALLVIFWGQIPDQVPLHWDWNGEVDDFSDAGGYIMLVILMYFFLFGQFITIAALPNLSVKENLFGKELADSADEEDRIWGIRFILYLMMYCNVLVEGILAYIVVCGVNVRNLGTFFLPGIFLAFGLVFYSYFRHMYVLKRKIRLRR